MKKAYRYVIGFFALTCLFSLSYYFSYKTALKQFNNKAVKLEENLPENTLSAAVEADSQKAATITSETKYILEEYDIKKDSIKQNQLNVPGEFIGLTREKLIDYLKSYRNHIPLEEAQKGLISYELISFRNDEIVLRKSYNKDSVPYEFYLMISDGKVIVYYCDKKTVYEYTDISADTLPEEEQIKLYKGIGVKNQEELYSFLENYSS